MMSGVRSTPPSPALPVFARLRPAADEPPQAPPKWSVLVYSAADNNLYPYMLHDVAEMERVGSDAHTHVLVQIDHGRDGGGAQRIALRSDAALGGTPDVVDSPVEESLGSVNMGASDTLAGALRWALQKYPAEHTMLVISDHGNAWKGCCEDDSHLGWMNLPALKNALQTVTQETGRKLDVIGFDACLMANTEVAWQLKDQARYMVASEQTEGADGWPYTPILTPDTLTSMQAHMTQRLDLEPEALVKMIVEKSADTPNVIRTLSAVDLEKMEPLKDALVGLRGALLESGVTQPQLRDVLKQCERFFGYRDLGHWLKLLETDTQITAPAVKTAVQRVQEAYRDVIVAEQHSPEHPNATGLTIHLTKPNDTATYMALDFQKATDWVAVGNKTGPP